MSDEAGTRAQGRAATSALRVLTPINAVALLLSGLMLIVMIAELGNELEQPGTVAVLFVGIVALGVQALLLMSTILISALARSAEPRRRAYAVAMISAAIVLNVTILACILFLPHPVEERVYEKRVTLSPKLRLVETHLSQRSHFTGIEGIWLPLPNMWHGITKQVVYLNGQFLYSTEREQHFFPSPDERYLLAVDYLHSEPFLIIDCVHNQRKVVPEPAAGTEGHYWVYPFGFHKWEADSSRILAYVQGTIVGQGLTAYRDSWAIDPATGNSEKLQRETQPWCENLTWDSED